MTEFQRRVGAVIAALGAGDVVSYGEVAEEAGFPGAAQAVGNFLRSPVSEGLPWWRVIPADGRLMLGMAPDWGDRLRAEGVDVVDGRVRRPGAGGTGGAGGRRRPARPVKATGATNRSRSGSGRRRAAGA